MNDIEYIRRLPREVAIAAGLRKIAPRPDRIPNESNLRVVPQIDTGAAFRADWRMQDPSKDPKEPYGSESSGTGNDHGWSNCTMVSAALCYAYAVQDKSGPQGGDMRHHQDDMSGGTDLYDADTAFHRYGDQNLDIRTGEGWSSVKAAHNEGRAILIQGEGNVPGDESFDGSHACVIAPETHSDGRWLFGDPLATGWQWVEPSKIESWAKNLGSGIYFAVTKVQSTPPPPTPEPEPEPPKPPPPPFYYPAMPATDYEVEAYQSELLRDTYYWLKHPTEKAPFPLADVLEMVPNAGWGVGKWNQTTWYLDQSAARWGESLWAGEATIEGGRWA